MTSLRRLPKETRFTPQEWGAQFPRDICRARWAVWYERAADRYLRRWLRGRNGVYSGPTIHLERVPDIRCWVVQIYWDWLEIPAAHGVAEIDWIEEIP